MKHARDAVLVSNREHKFAAPFLANWFILIPMDS